MKAVAAFALLTAPPSAFPSQPDDPAFREYVAAYVKVDCLLALTEAPNEAMKQHLRTLCDCTEQKLLATQMGSNDNDESINRKVRAATSACYAELGGAPGEKGR